MKDMMLVILMGTVTVCSYISYIPQITKLIKTKKAEDLSICSWVLWTASALADLLYSLILGRVELMIASISEFLLISVTLVLTVYYDYKNNYYLESEEVFQKKVNRIRGKDGNHMIALTAIQQDRIRRIENRRKIPFLK